METFSTIVASFVKYDLDNIVIRVMSFDLNFDILALLLQAKFVRTFITESILAENFFVNDNQFLIFSRLEDIFLFFLLWLHHSKIFLLLFLIDLAKNGVSCDRSRNKLVYHRLRASSVVGMILLLR